MVDREEYGRYCGYQMGQVLSGINPGDLPIIQITRLELTLNLKSAKSLGIEFPASLLGTADFIIE
jgi:putative tryptophan/tyrosine transport system substrate-binding protein